LSQIRTENRFPLFLDLLYVPPAFPEGSAVHASLPSLDLSPELLQAAGKSKAWPFEEAGKLVARLKRRSGAAREVIFETGYGPSGLPHIGTFGEVARTTMVRTAFRVLTEDRVPTRLICFSDDMDGLRKVPTNVPNQEEMARYLHQPLTSVPDPFGEYESFGGGNNARLRKFLDRFGFSYEFMSATEAYRSGRFDKTLLAMLAAYDEVMAIMLPTLGEERQQTYSPFLPVSPATGAVLQVPILERKVEAGTIVFRDPANDKLTEVPVTGGNVKCQWKADWALRWTALGVDYEMAGKDLIDSVKLSGKICKVLGGEPPEGFNYELFLDEHGQKISKSKGNGLTIDEWLTYASPESLSLFMYREPKAAKRLHFDVIPRAVDEYYQFLDGYGRQDVNQRLSNPVWHIHSGHPPSLDMPISFAMLLTLVSSSNAENAETLWGFIGRYRPGVTPATHPQLDALVGYAIHYFHDFVLPAKRFRDPTAEERAALSDLRDALAGLPADASAETIQDVVYEVGRREPFLDEKKKAKDGKPGVSLDWFNMLYQVLLGQERGPRFGTFVEAFGVPNTVAMIDGALARSA
jgi:lysyl-tRNA synthetase class 1